MELPSWLPPHVACVVVLAASYTYDMSVLRRASLNAVSNRRACPGNAQSHPLTSKMSAWRERCFDAKLACTNHQDGLLCFSQIRAHVM